MKAIVYSTDGSRDGLECEEIERPVVGDNEILIRVRAASVNPIDYHLLRHPFVRRMLMRKLNTARPGRDVAGEVEAVGRKVTQFKPGDAVFGACGGAFAEYVCAPESALVTKPNNLSFEHAASMPVAALTALQGLRDKGQIQPGQRVLINGAAGGVGTFAVQAAKSFGADVTGVCSTRNVDLVRSIGADRVIDYTREDFTKSTQRYDLIFDLVANHSFSARRRALNPKGRYVGAGAMALQGSMIGLLVHQATELVLSRIVSQTFVTFIAKLSKDDLTLMCHLISSGKVTPIIDRRYSLREVPEALRYLEEGHARGKVVIILE